MRFTLDRLIIKNFKGVREQDIEFSPEETTICGDNGVGKTTIVDAFNWLLFEKDSKGRSQFEIKTLENGEPIHGLDHSVEGHFTIDGRPLKLKKVYREVWTKRRGEIQETFTGHEIERLVNDIPSKKSEYDKKINELIDEKIFQLLTDPLHFSQQLNWKERRRALFELSGKEITPEEIISKDPELKEMEKELEIKTIEELKKSLSYQRKNLNKDRENIPVQINTLQGTIKDIDIESTKLGIEEIKLEIQNIENQMLDSSKKNEEKLKKQDELYRLKSRLKEIEYETKENQVDPNKAINDKIRELGEALKEKDFIINGENNTKKMLQESIDRQQAVMDKLRDDYSREMNRKLEIPNNITACPTCKRDFPENEVEQRIKELEGNFKANQVETLKEIRDKGQGMAEEVQELEATVKEIDERINRNISEIETIQKEIDELKEKITTENPDDLTDQLKNNSEYRETILKIEELENELEKKEVDHESEKLKDRKRELELELKKLEMNLYQYNTNKETKAKIESLLEKEKELSAEINIVERKENLADRFISIKTELIEKNINDKFERVSFRLFKRQINGAIDETCDVLVEGVPFDNANTAGQINAGLDVINSLCKHYETYTPIFIDNAESTNSLINTDSQVIKLKVTKHKGLNVQHEK